MKVLYLNTNTPDYLAESLFHGLRTILGDNCVDVPRYDSLYSPLTEEKRSKLRGHGFTIYGLLPELSSLKEKRSSWKKELHTYDLIVVADIWKMYKLFREVAKEVPSDKIIVLDGSDAPAVFPYISVLKRLWSDPASFFIPLSKVKYFKRELIGDGEIYNLKKLLPSFIRKHLKIPVNILPISFSIPSEKITKVNASHKKKLFNKHIVDKEVSEKVKDSFYSAIASDKHYFQSEEDYYEDIRISRFGITTKRMGWDCLRHYELAANGAVICFKNLDLKYPLCAPHGLDQTNSISYNGYEDLLDKINKLEQADYISLMENTYKWINNYTTEKTAERFLEESKV